MPSGPISRASAVASWRPQRMTLLSVLRRNTHALAAQTAALSGKAPSDWTGKLDVIVTAVTESGVAASARVSFEPGTSR